MSGGSRSSFREDNANGARAKSEGSIPITGDLVRCYSDYMHEEYGELDSDYVFVNLWAGRIGQPMSSDAVADLVRRTRAQVGFHFTPHMLRHTYVTVAMRGKVPLEVVSRLVTHSSVETTSGTYLHPSVEDLREALGGGGDARVARGAVVRTRRDREHAAGDRWRSRAGGLELVG